MLIPEVRPTAITLRGFTGNGARGWLRRLVRRSSSRKASRPIVQGLGAGLTIAIVLSGLVMLTHPFGQAFFRTLRAVTFPPVIAGSGVGLIGVAGSFGWALFYLAVKEILPRYRVVCSFFQSPGFLRLISFGVIMFVIRGIQLLKGQELDAQPQGVVR